MSSTTALGKRQLPSDSMQNLSRGGVRCSSIQQTCTSSCNASLKTMSLASASDESCIDGKNYYNQCTPLHFRGYLSIPEPEEEGDWGMRSSLSRGKPSVQRDGFQICGDQPWTEESPESGLQDRRAPLRLGWVRHRGPGHVRTGSLQGFISFWRVHACSEGKAGCASSGRLLPPGGRMPGCCNWQLRPRALSSRPGTTGLAVEERDGVALEAKIRVSTKALQNSA